MIVITLTDCPPALRGDITKWLQEICTGVYIGQVSARVRDEIWKRVQEKAKNGRATMVFSAKNEQHLDFRVHNNVWKPIDFDGLKLMLRPATMFEKEENGLKSGFSNAAKMHKARHRVGQRRSSNPLPVKYIVVDVETTGLSATEHEIIEICAIKVNEKQIDDKFHAIVKPKKSIPISIESLTGLSDQILSKEGRDIKEVLPELLLFIGDLPVVSHNVDFDYNFLRAACENTGLPLFSNQCVDTYALAQRLVDDVKNYKLATLVEYFGLTVNSVHRSTEDCIATKYLYEKLIEIHQGAQ